MTESSPDADTLNSDRESRCALSYSTSFLLSDTILNQLKQQDDV